jgi:hypothetical protein
MDIIQIGLGKGQAVAMEPGCSGRRTASVDGW